MVHNYTLNSLIEYIYGETTKDALKHLEVEHAIENDFETRNLYGDLLIFQQNLSDIEMSPKEEAVDFILSWSESDFEDLIIN